MSTLIKLIKDARAKAGISQRAASIAINNDTHSVTNWESGNSAPRPDLLPAISIELKIPKNELWEAYEEHRRGLLEADLKELKKQFLGRK